MEDKQMIKIAEKVKFWEEQDKINQELIPRVFKNHEMITKVSERSLKIIQRIGELEGENKKITNSYSKSQSMMEDVLNKFYQNHEVLNEGQYLLEKVRNLENDNMKLKEDLNFTQVKLKNVIRGIYLISGIVLVTMSIFMVILFN